VVVAAVATATALVVGVGTVLAVDDRRRKASDLTTPSPRSFPPSATQSARSTPKATPSVSQPAPLLLPNMRSLSASDLHIEVVGDSRRLRFAASLANVGPGPLFLCPVGGVTARPDSMRPSSYCIEMSITTARFSAAGTVRDTGERPVACFAIPATSTGTSMRWRPTH
jgi:hypothetical protein